MYGKRGVKNPSYRQRTAHHAMLLGGMAAITSALLVIADKQTAPDIELRHAEDVQNSLAQVIPSDMHTNNLLDDVLEVKAGKESRKIYLAKSDDKVVAVAFNTSAEGYAGPIDVVIGIDIKGELLGTRVLSHSETPGLGDKIEAEKDPWIFSFNGLSLSNPGESQWKVKKDGGYFDQFTGATITPRAVINAVKNGLQYFQSNKTKIFAVEKKESSPTKTEPLHKEANNESNEKPLDQSAAEKKVKQSKIIKGNTNG